VSDNDLGAVEEAAQPDGAKPGAGAHVEVVVRQDNGELVEDVIEVTSVEGDGEDGSEPRVIEARPVPSAPRRAHPGEPLPGSLEHDRAHPAD
jgi:hypothetical protein